MSAILEAKVYVGGSSFGGSKTLDALARKVGGWTLYDTQGGWVGDDDKLWTEKATVLEFMGERADVEWGIRLIADAAKAAGEESVLVVRQLVDAQFIAL